MAGKRFVIEGVWLGYRSSQDHVVHRQVYPGSRQQLRAWADKTFAITYTDGTRLQLSVRDCKPRERVQEIKGYTSLIEDCARHDVTSVGALEDAVQAARTAREAA
jgi:hypothetical protein